MENRSEINPVQRIQATSNAEQEAEGWGQLGESVEAKQLMELQNAANESAQVQQLKQIQSGADGSPQVQQLKALQRALNAESDDAGGLESAGAAESAQSKTGGSPLPGALVAGVESLSGFDLHSVRVHYNSTLPALVGAHAFARDNQIFIAPGQDAYLPHEAWHIVQQMQGRVKANAEGPDGSPVNDDPVLEKEADIMGAKALAQEGKASETPAVAKQRQTPLQAKPASSGAALQLAKKKEDKKDNQNNKKKQKARRKKKIFTSKNKELLLKRLFNTNQRNKQGKAIPRKFRFIHLIQDELNYGFKTRSEQLKLHRERKEDSSLKEKDEFDTSINEKYTQMSIGDANGYYRRGFGNQPFLYLQKDEYDDTMIKSNYDEVIGNFSGKDAKVAFEILQMIENGDVDFGTKKMGQAKSLFFLLTQFIEAHSSRIPGADKFARALLRRIACGNLTFAKAFNRKDGLFTSAWAKAAKAKTGGQVGGRALFGQARDKDKFTVKDLEKVMGSQNMEEIYETIDEYLSEESDNEDDRVELYDEVKKDPELLIQQTNDALKLLGIDLTISNIEELNQLGSMAGMIEDSYFECLADLEEEDTTDLDEAADHLDSIVRFLNYGKEPTYKLEKLRTDHLSKLKLKKRNVEAKGNCFYDSSADQLEQVDGTVVSVLTLRGLLAQLILNNQDYFKVYVTGNQLMNVVDQILTNNSWQNIGGDFAPQLMATVLQRRIVIVQPGGPINIDPIANLDLTNATLQGTGTQLTITYDGIGHYDSTELIEEDMDEEIE